MAKNTAPKKSANNERYAIENVLDPRLDANFQREYLIQWKDLPETQKSWQSVKDLFVKCTKFQKEEVSPIEEVLKSRMNVNSQREFFVKWSSNKRSSWISVENLFSTKQTLIDLDVSYKKKNNEKNYLLIN